MPSEHEELFSALNELWQHYPQWRFGQLVSNVAAWAGEDAPGEIGEVSNAEMLHAAQEHLLKLRSEGPRKAAV